MLRKMRFEGPPSRYEALVEAARGAGLELDDYAIDTTGAYGWPMLGNGCAVVDDDERTPEDVVLAIRAAHERAAGSPGDWIVSAGSFVYLPDGLEPEWYVTAGGLAEALHAAECGGDIARARALRVDVERIVSAALPWEERALARVRRVVRGLAHETAEPGRSDGGIQAS